MIESKIIIFSKMSLRNRRFFCSSENNSTETIIKESLRSTQAVQIFRQAYYKASNSTANISLTDLSQVMLSERVRPSLLLGTLQGAAHTTGFLSRFIPIQSMDKIVSKAIDDAAQQQINDSVRKLSNFEDTNEVRETLKFHRDIRVAPITVEAENIPNLSELLKSGNVEQVVRNALPTILTTCLYETFKVTEKL